MEFGLYVSPVKGRTVPRFGAPVGTYIGARRVGKQLEWDEEKIVPIPENEYRRFRAEYDGATAEGALKKHSADEYKAAQEALKKKREEVAKAAQDGKPNAAPAADAVPVPEPAAGIRAIAETAPVVSPSAQAERPRAVPLTKEPR
jgi:hypothetical protein